MGAHDLYNNILKYALYRIDLQNWKTQQDKEGRKGNSWGTWMYKAFEWVGM